MEQHFVQILQLGTRQGKVWLLRFWDSGFASTLPAVSCQSPPSMQNRLDLPKG